MKTMILMALLGTTGTAEAIPPAPPIGTDAAILAFLGIPGNAVISGTSADLIVAHLAEQYTRQQAVIAANAGVDALTADAVAAKAAVRLAQLQQQVIMQAARGLNLFEAVANAIASRATMLLGLFVIDGGQYQGYPILGMNEGASYGAITVTGEGTISGESITCWMGSDFDDAFGAFGSDSGYEIERTETETGEDPQPEEDGDGDSDEYGEGTYQLSDAFDGGDHDGCVVQPWPDGGPASMSQLSDFALSRHIEVVNMLKDDSDRVCVVLSSEVDPLALGSAYTQFSIVDTNNVARDIVGFCGNTAFAGLNLPANLDVPDSRELDLIEAQQVEETPYFGSTGLRPTDLEAAHR